MIAEHQASAPPLLPSSPSPLSALAARTETAFATALRHHEGGRFVAARAIYEAILAEAPNHADSLHLLGLIEISQNTPARAVPLIERAMVAAPGSAAHHNSLGLAHRALGNQEEALRQFRIAARLRPDSPEILSNLATALRDLGRGGEAVAQYRLAAHHAPGMAEIWYNLANALAEIDAAGPEIEACYRRAVTLCPGHADAQANYGRWLMLSGNWGAAALHLEQATRLAPGNAAAWNNLGVVNQELNRATTAEACYRHALARDTAFSAAWYNLGCLLSAGNRTDEAIACHDTAVAVDARCGRSRLALCMAQLPILFASVAEMEERRRRYAAQLSRLAALARTAEGARILAPALGTTQPFFLPYQGLDDRALMAEYGDLAWRVMEATQPVLLPPPPPRPGERIRIGIISGFFCDHTIFRLFLEGWITCLDRDRFEVIGVHTGTIQDAQTDWAAAHCDHFIRGLHSSASWRAAIVDAAPHVLLYPEIGMDPICFRLAAQRIARLQCVAWGHPETTGLPTLDCFLSSALMEPPEADSFYTERLVRLPGIGAHYTPDTAEIPAATRAEFGLREGVPVFWSGQALYKYHPDHDAIFPRIAAAVGAASVGDCQFVFIDFAKSPAVTAAFRGRLEASFAAHGLDAARHCVFLAPMSQSRFIAAAALADVVLDTPAWSGGKSTLDLLVHDPAIVTWPGRFMRGRHSAAILRQIGCEDTIAQSADDYVAIATRLAQDKDWRQAQRARMAASKARAWRDRASITALEDFLVENLAG